MVSTTKHRNSDLKALMARKVLILQKFSLIFDEFKKDFRV
ncbi:hypothetical protein K708_1465 [Campylobacter coli JL-CDD-LMH]|nr:hypothetical protein HMPREF9399_1006 [Campylobacter coli JV20]OWT29694.1 hypothetical protein K708_1465 [Campylobacter coli JL-CDD-LMH]OWT31433.1 hypothetical protein K709_0748 [Campylobacter coli HN-CCD07046]CDL89071.1 hypothetical protein CCIPSID_11730 [Campylobacter coli IPSID-1]